MIDAIAALANRFWRIHPKEIQDLGITREQFYEQEMRVVFATQAAHIEALEAELKLTKEHLNEGGRIILANVARIETLEARLDRAVTRGLEQVEQIATLEAALRWIRDSKTDDRLAAEFARAALAPEQNK